MKGGEGASRVEAPDLQRLVLRARDHALSVRGHHAREYTAGVTSQRGKAAPRVAEGWQAAVRKGLQHYLGRGYVGADFVYAQGSGREIGRRRPMYILRKG